MEAGLFQTQLIYFSFSWCAYVLYRSIVSMATCWKMNDAGSPSYFSVLRFAAWTAADSPSPTGVTCRSPHECVRSLLPTRSIFRVPNGPTSSRPAFYHLLWKVRWVLLCWKFLLCRVFARLCRWPCDVSRIGLATSCIRSRRSHASSPTISPHWWGPHGLMPSLSPTAILTVSLSWTRPHAVTGIAFSQSPECGLRVASNLALLIRVSRQLVYGHFVYIYFVYYDFPCWNRSGSDETNTISIETVLMQIILPN